MRLGEPSHEGTQPNMTPMIDIVFLLIAFFMVLINFTEADQNERIRLPSSELARPPEAAPTEPLTLQVTESGTVLYGREEYQLSDLPRALDREMRILTALDVSPDTVTVILRGDVEVETGIIQEVIRHCQDAGMEIFKLRAKQEQAAPLPTPDEST